MIKLSARTISGPDTEGLVMIGLHAAVLASYRRIVSMKDLKQVFEDMEDAWRKKAQSLDVHRLT